MADNNDDLDRPSFDVVSLPGKGLALVAKRDIHVGEIVVREKPTIVMPNQVFDCNDMERIERWLDRRINNHLLAEDRQAFFDLSDHRSAIVNEHEQEERTTLGIFFTNCMDFSGDAAILPTIARINHACVPNADFLTRADLGTQDVVAIKPIGKGKEITVSYLPAGDFGSDVRDVRQAYLRQYYGFQCLCSTCTLKDELLEKDEALRRRIRQRQRDGINQLSSKEADSFLLDLSRAGIKLSYHLKVCKVLFRKALIDDDRVFAAQVFANAYLTDHILHPDAKSTDWDHILESDYVSIAGKGFFLNSN